MRLTVGEAKEIVKNYHPRVSVFKTDNGILDMLSEAINPSIKTLEVDSGEYSGAIQGILNRLMFVYGYRTCLVGMGRTGIKEEGSRYYDKEFLTINHSDETHLIDLQTYYGVHFSNVVRSVLILENSEESNQFPHLSKFNRDLEKDLNHMKTIKSTCVQKISPSAYRITDSTPNNILELESSCQEVVTTQIPTPIPTNDIDSMSLSELVKSDEMSSAIKVLARLELLSPELKQAMNIKIHNALTKDVDYVGSVLKTA